MAGVRRRASEETKEGRILRAIRRIIRSVDIYSHKLALDCGVTVPQLSCLLQIAESGPLTLKALAQQVDLTAGTVVGIIDRLERKGLVERTRSQIDRRQVRISISQQGKSLVARAPSPLQDRLAQALDGLPLFDRAAIALSLERIVDLMGIAQVGAAPILDTGISLQPVTESLTARSKEKALSAAPSAPAVSDA
jgi:DNA-binding MarR family transcriptional regulator